MKKEKVLLFFVLLFLCSCVSVRAGHKYRQVDPSVFSQSGYIDKNKTEIVSPGRKWTWYNSWNIIRRKVGHSGNYTLDGSFSKRELSRYTWAHYCYFLYRGQLAERYSSINYISKVEDRIEKVTGRVANVMRIDKLGNRLYVVTYRRSRSAYKYFHPREVDGYQLFNLPKDIKLNDDAVFFSLRIRGVDRYGVAEFGYRVMRISIKNVLFLDPRFFSFPGELEDILIPYSYFDNNFIYNHPQVKIKSEDPVMIKATRRGIVVRFRKGSTIEEL